LLYGVYGEGGFVLLTGEVGTGKTTICRCLLEQIPEPCVVAYIFNPRLTVDELLSSICVEFGIDFPLATPASNCSLIPSTAIFLTRMQGKTRGANY